MSFGEHALAPTLALVTLTAGGCHLVFGDFNINPAPTDTGELPANDAATGDIGQVDVGSASDLAAGDLLPVDGAADAAVAPDSGVTDTGASEAGAEERVSLDAPVADTAEADAGPPGDAGSQDGTTLDVAAADTSGGDAGGGCPPGEHDGGDGTCVLVGTCLTGYHDGGDGDCVTEGACSPSYHDGGNGICVAEGTCLMGYHDGGDGSCMPEGECADSYHDGGDGVCVDFWYCSVGYHDGGNGDCLPEGSCAPGYHDGGTGVCVVVGTCLPGYHNGGAGVCVREGSCSTGYHDGGVGDCVAVGNCSLGYHDGGAGDCVAVGSCSTGFEGAPQCRPEPPEILPAFSPPTGWLDEHGDPILLSFVSDTPDARYYCWTGLDTEEAPESFAPCDPDDDSAPFHEPGPTPLQADGTYRTEVEVWHPDNDLPSSRASVEYYVHRSLDNAPRCPPLLDPDDYFTFASRYLDRGVEFNASTVTRTPFVKLGMEAQSSPRRVHLGPDARWDPEVDYLDWRLSLGKEVPDVISLLSLRKRFVLNDDRTLLLLERTHISRSNPGVVGCNTAVDRYTRCDGESAFPGFEEVDLNGGTWRLRPQHCSGDREADSVTCRVVVMNARGNAVCLGVDDSSVALRRLDPFFGNSSTKSIFKHFSEKTTSPEIAEEYADWLYLPP